MTGISKNTISKLLLDLGGACTSYQDQALPNLPCNRIQCDEIWSFVGGKDKNLSEEKKRRGLGSIWTWTAICADTKLIPSWLVGSRDAGAAFEFMQDVASPLKHRVQLTTDAHRPYLNAVEDAFGSDIDYAVLQKLYGSDPDGEKRHSPATCIGVKSEIVQGDPNPKRISNVLQLRPDSSDAARVTPAMAAGATDHVWEVEEIVGLLG